MTKKAKLNLNELRVQSFVTSLHNDEKKRLKGGIDPDKTEECISRPYLCPTEPAYPTCGGQETCGSFC